MKDEKSQDQIEYDFCLMCGKLVQAPADILNAFGRVMCEECYNKEINWEREKCN